MGTHRGERGQPGASSDVGARAPASEPGARPTPAPSSGLGSEDTLAEDGAPVPAQPDIAEAYPRGSALGRYLVLERLGVGGMGVVYAAYDPDLDRKVAVKLVRPRARVRGDGKATRRLLREAQAMAKLTHPNVVAVHDVGTVGDEVFVAMEFVEGMTLRRWLEQDWRPSQAEVVDVMIAAARGLAAAHDRGLVHRDFKPDNVMLTTDGRVVVMDFGLAAHEGPRRRVTSIPTDGTDDVGDTPATPDTSESRQRALAAAVDILLTDAGSLVGTPAYMSPEQLGGLPADTRSDQFGFCVAMYEALYGVRPFESTSLQSLVFAVTAGRLRPDPKNANVPRWLRRVLVRGLSTNPDERWPSMDALIAALSDSPVRRRRWWVGALVVGAAVFVSAVGLQWRRASARAACDAEAATLAQTWDPARRDDLRRSLVATRVPGAAESADRAIGNLDEWAASWAAQRRSVCERATIDEELSPQLWTRAQACLDDQREHVAAIVDVYSTDAPGVVAGIVHSTARLGQLDRCDDALRLANRPQDAAADAGTMSAIRRDLARAEALADAGRYHEGLEVSRDALTRATRFGAPAAEAEARLITAAIRSELGEYREVVAPLQAAFVRATSAGADELGAKAAIALLRVHGYHLAEPQPGLAWAAVAQALLERTNRTTGLDAAALANNLGLTHETRGDLQAAFDSHTRALRLREDALGPDHPQAAHSYGNLGNVELARGRPQQALRWHFRALEVRTQSLGENHPDTARSHNNLGKVFLGMQRIDEALHHFERAREILEPSLGREHRVTARVGFNIGRAYLGRGEPDLAAKQLREAWEIQTRVLGAQHPETARSAQQLGLAQLALHDLPAATATLRRALTAQRISLGTNDPEAALTESMIAVACQAGYARACAGSP